ncbi:MAG: NAD(P)H-binding protein [Actinomycetota bacterium]
MSHITVIGGNGYTGAAIVSESLERGHTVTVVSRSVPDAPVEGVAYVTGSALEPAVLDEALTGADFAVVAVSSRGGEAQAAPTLAGLLVERAAQSGVKLLVVGGFSSLRPSADEPRVIEGEVPEQYLAEATAGHDSLEALLAAPSGVSWTFFSPAAHYGSWVEGKPSGAYKLGGEVMILDPETGTSYLHADDLADAVLDVLESDEPARGHVSVVS